MLLGKVELALLDGWSAGSPEPDVRPGPAPRHWAPAYVFLRMTMDIPKTHIKQGSEQLCS